MRVRVDKQRQLYSLDARPLSELDAVVDGTAVPGVWDDYYPALQAGYGLPT